jgi:hypothetical protein
MEPKSKYIKTYAEICNILEDFLNSCGSYCLLDTIDFTYFSGLSLSDIFTMKPFIRRDNPAAFEDIVRKYVYCLNRHYVKRNPNIFKRPGKISEILRTIRIQDI